MPDFESAANTIRSTFATNLDSVFPTRTAFYDNQKGDPPNGEIWLRLSVRDGAAFEAALGGLLYRFPGVAIVQIFAPLGHGDGELRELADTIAGWFRGKRIDSVRFFAPPYLTHVGMSDGWHQVNLTVPFEYDLTP